MKILAAVLVSLVCLSSLGAPPPPKSLKVAFEDRIADFRFPLGEIDPALPSDWSGYGFLVLEMRASSPQRLSLWLHTASGGRRVMLQLFGQNAWLRAAVPLRYFQGKDQRGMDLSSTNNRRTDSFWFQVMGPFGDLKGIESIGIRMDYPLGRPGLEIRSITLSKDDPGSSFLEPSPVTDELGQWALADWPRRVRSRDQLDREWADEEKVLSGATNESFGWDKYGGDLGTQAKATGFFRVERVDGRWWFVDPDGHLFLSTGSNGTPGGGGPNEKRPGTAARSVRRMTAWGLNTIGNWSSLKSPSAEERKAYVAMLRPPRSEPYFLGIPDVYSEEFARAVEQAAEKQCAPLRDDPWLLGYFLGNEPPWARRESELVDMFLNGPGCATQRELKILLAEGDTPSLREEIVRGMFKRYLEMMSAAIRKADPNHLNLGIRFGGLPAESILRLGESFDVFSTNIYEYEPTRQLARIAEIVDKPILIGEFHFGVPADGLGAGLVQCADQAERSKGYRYYMEQAAALPCFVGAHWFQWTDQPVLGRMDGENYNIGFIDVTDRAYPELVAAAKETHRRLARVHAGKIEPFAERPKASAHGTPASPWD
jgi:hypothetical protein